MALRRQLLEVVELVEPVIAIINRTHRLNPVLSVAVTVLTAMNLGVVGQDNFRWNLPANTPRPPIPADNPMTDDKVLLGRFLFYDKRLSSNGKISCSSCHRQEYAFSSGPTLTIGVSGQAPKRKAPSLGNVAYYPVLTWGNPSIDSLEKQVLVPLLNAKPREMGGNDRKRVDSLLALFRSDPIYRRLFRSAFPSQPNPYSLESMAMAIAAFERTLLSWDSPYDRYLREQRSSMSAAAMEGAKLFFSDEVACHVCHAGPTLTRNFAQQGRTSDRPSFANVGLYNVAGKNEYPRGDRGLYEVTSRPEDHGAFRIPTLRNVAQTAPFMHDRSVSSLRSVLSNYSRGGRYLKGGPNRGDGARNAHKSSYMQGFELSSRQEQQLEAFLHSLTDASLLSKPEFGDPWARKERTPSSSMRARRKDDKSKLVAKEPDHCMLRAVIDLNCRVRSK